MLQCRTHGNIVAMPLIVICLSVSLSVDIDRKCANWKENSFVERRKTLKDMLKMVDCQKEAVAIANNKSAARFEHFNEEKTDGASTDER